MRYEKRACGEFSDAEIFVSIVISSPGTHAFAIRNRIVENLTWEFFACTGYESSAIVASVFFLGGFSSPRAISVRGREIFPGQAYDSSRQLHRFDVIDPLSLALPRETEKYGGREQSRPTTWMLPSREIFLLRCANQVAARYSPGPASKCHFGLRYTCVRIAQNPMNQRTYVCYLSQVSGPFSTERTFLCVLSMI